MNHINIITNPFTLKNPFIDPKQWTLCTKGIENAKELASLNIWGNIKKIYSGPEISDCQTSIIISGLCKIPFFIKENLKTPTFEKKYLFDEKYYKKALQGFFKFPHLNFGDTEKCEDTQRRLIGCINEIMNENKNKNISIITSCMNLELLKSYILGKKPELTDLSDEKFITTIDWGNKKITKEISSQK